MVKSDCFIHCFFPLGTRERTEGPGLCLHLALSFPLSSSLLPISPFQMLPSFSFQIVVLFYRVLIPGFSWIVMISVERLSQQKQHPHLYIYVCIYMLLFFCFLAPSGLCGVIWFNYFWQFAHQNVQFFKGMKMTVNLPPPEQLRFSFESCCLGNK